MTDTNYTMPTVRGEAQLAVDIPAGGYAVIDFEVIQNGTLSWFCVHREKSGAENARVALGATIEQDGTVYSSAGYALSPPRPRDMGSNEPWGRHSGLPNLYAWSAIVPLEPGRYQAKVFSPDGLEHKGIVIGRMNGATIAVG